MSPSLKEGDVVVAVPMEPMVGDVVVIKHQGLEKIKRISRLGRDKIEVLGDNAPSSTDSRQFGELPMTSIVGRVVWPRGLHQYR
jgi:signal peptidase I